MSSVTNGRPEYTEMRPRCSRVTTRVSVSVTFASGRYSDTKVILDADAVARLCVERRRQLALHAEERLTYRAIRLAKAFGAILHAGVFCAGKPQSQGGAGDPGRGRTGARRARSAATPPGLRFMNKSGA